MNAPVTAAALLPGSVPLAVTDLAVDTGIFQLTAADSIRPSKTNPRKTFTEAYLQELAGSIKENGVAQPILIRPVMRDMIDNHPTHYEIVCGERRYRACLLLGKTEIPTLIRELTDEQALAIQVIENLQREDLHPLEEADGFRQLMDAGLSADDVARRIGKSKGTVYAALKLCSLCPKVRALFQERKLETSVALLIARIPLAIFQERAATEIITYQYSYRQAARHIENNFTLSLTGIKWAHNDKTLVPEAGSCKDCPKRTGNQPELYPDVSANVCTDPACFATKRNVMATRLTEKAQEAGAPVIKGPEAKQIKPNAYGSLANGYVDVDEPGIVAGKERLSVRGVLGKKMPLAAALIDPHEADTIRYVLQRDVLAPLIEAAGFEMPPESRYAQEAADSRAREREIERKMKLQRTYRRELYARLRDEHYKNCHTPVLHTENLFAIAEKLWNRCDRTIKPFVMSIWNWPDAWLNDYKERDKIDNAIAEMNGYQLQNFIADVIMADELYISSFNVDKPPTQLLAAAERMKVDHETILQAAQPKPKKAKKGGVDGNA